MNDWTELDGVVLDKLGRTVAEVHNPKFKGDPGGNEEYDRRRKLIAKAPEMFELLEEALQYGIPAAAICRDIEQLLNDVRGGG